MAKIDDMKTTIEHVDEPATISISPDQLQKILQEVVRAAKEPDEATKQKLAEEAALKERRLKESIEMAKAEEEARELRWRTCAHIKPDGRTAVAKGQVFSDGFYHPFCLVCQKPFPLVKPTPEDMI